MPVLLKSRVESVKLYYDTHKDEYKLSLYEAKVIVDHYEEEARKRNLSTS